MADVTLSSIIGNGGEKTPASVNGLVGNGAFSVIIGDSLRSAAFKESLSGALTANTYKNVLSIAVPGRLLIAAAYRRDTISRQVGLKITLDGVIFYDVFDKANSSIDRGPLGAGIILQSSSIHTHNYPFKTMSVDIKSSLTETDKIAYIIVYTLDQ